MPKTKTQLREEWSARFRPLIGKTIANVHYLDEEEMEQMGWSRAAIVLQLSDGTLLYPSMDDEGNDAGALFLQPGKGVQIPEAAPAI